MSPVDQIIIFLTALFGSDLDGLWILVWTNPGRKSAFFRTIEEAAAYAAKQQGVNVYFGICLSPENYGPDKRCPASCIAAVPGLWADIDIADPAAHSKTNLPATVAEAKALLSDLPLPPTLIVHSGNGLHAYWLFKEPWTIDNDVERAEAASLSRGWNETVMVHAKRRGLVVDMTYDLARVFRLPGTSNVKDPANPKPVTILEHYDERRYLQDDFPQYFPEDISAYLVDMERDNRYLDIKLTRKPTVNQVALDEGFSLEPKFKSTWLHKRRDFKDQSFSSYDMALASYAVQCGWTDQQIADLIVAFRQTYGKEADIKKAFRLDYVSTTIKKARETFGKSEVEKAQDTALDEMNARIRQEAVTKYQATKDHPMPAEQTLPDSAPVTMQTTDAEYLPAPAEQKAPEPSKEALGSHANIMPKKVTPEERKLLLESVRAKLGIHITRVVKYLADPPTFALETAMGTVRLGKINNLIRLGLLQTCVAEAIGEMIPSKIKEWDKVAQNLMRLIEPVSVGEEATQDGQTKEWIFSYLETKKVTDDWENSWRDKAPFRRDGKTCIYMASLKKFLSQQGDRIDSKDLAPVLRQFGCIPRSLSVFIDGKRTTRNVYELPDIGESYAVYTGDNPLAD